MSLFTQEYIDRVRSRVTLHLIRSVLMRATSTKIWHIWFPNPKTEKHYELRYGNPPHDVERPQHLKGKILSIDLGLVPQSVVNALSPGGEIERIIDDALDKEGISAIDKSVRKQIVIKRAIDSFTSKLLKGSLVNE